MERGISNNYIFVFFLTIRADLIRQTQGAADGSGLHPLLRHVPIPDSIRRGKSELCELVRPCKGGVDWQLVHAKVQVTAEEDILMCEEEGSGHPSSNLLHCMSQFNTAPVLVDVVTTELQHALDVTTLVIGVFKRHDALD